MIELQVFVCLLACVAVCSATFGKFGGGGGGGGGGWSSGGGGGGGNGWSSGGGGGSSKGKKCFRIYKWKKLKIKSKDEIF